MERQINEEIKSKSGKKIYGKKIGEKSKFESRKCKIIG
jgi:hypothetical protein